MYWGMAVHAHHDPSEDYLSTALAALRSLPGTSVVVFDADLRYVLVAGQAVSQAGFDVAAMEGRPAADVLAPERWAVWEPFYLAALRGEANALELEGVGVDHSRRFQVEIGPWRVASGAVAGGLAMVRDITHQKLAQDHDISERKQMEKELRASREQALEASRLKSEFVTNMSHEIRTPLNGVVCMAELLLGTELGSDQREYAEVAMTSAESLMRVIDDILDFSKIEAGKLDILHEDYSLEPMISEVCEIVGVKAHEKQLELAVSIDPDVPSVVRGDGNRVRQVLVNLLDNAVKFTSEGEIVVHVGTDRRRGAVDRLRIEVTDTGIGIDKRKLARLFHPFSQADTSMTRKYGGTGLGLCIAKQLVELMGGRLGVQSSPGEGSTFSFTVPCEAGTTVEAEPSVKDLTAPDGLAALELMGRAAAAGRVHEVACLDRATRAAGSRSRPEPGEGQHSSARHVLVAEDNEINQFAATQVLRKLGFTVDIASNGREAIEMTAGTDYAAIFMDCQMPEVDGYTATETIRARDAGGRHTPIIAVTAHTMEGDRAKCLAAGMDEYIAKPIRLAELARVCDGLDKLGPPLDSTSSSLRPLFEPTGLFEIANSDQIGTLIRMFIDQANDQLPRLEQSLAARDATTANEIAHGLKGSAATVGAPRVTEICDAICELAQRGTTDGGAELCATLVDALAATRRLMLAYLDR
jgi:signal transduction histidine kinase/DNA-binding NarL/FixJ family response regulator